MNPTVTAHGLVLFLLLSSETMDMPPRQSNNRFYPNAANQKKKMEEVNLAQTTVTQAITFI